MVIDDNFLIFLPYIDRGGSYEYPQAMFSAKIMYTPVNFSFPYIK